MKKKLILLSFCILIFYPCFAQYPTLDRENGINNFQLGSDISIFKGELEFPKQEEKIYTAYMYSDKNEDRFNILGIKFSLIVLVFDQNNKLAKFRISERYNSDSESQFSRDYTILGNVFEKNYGIHNIVPYSDDGTLSGMTWKSDDVELGLLKLDVENYGSKQLTVQFISNKLIRENEFKKLKQNKIAIDKITGFSSYQFGKTQKDYDCDSWLCEKRPVNLYIGNNSVESISLNFSTFGLYALVIKFTTDDKILETLTSKYGEPYNDYVNNNFEKNLLKYRWEGNTISIIYYSENSKYYLHYFKVFKKSLNEL